MSEKKVTDEVIATSEVAEATEAVEAVEKKALAAKKTPAPAEKKALTPEEVSAENEKRMQEPVEIELFYDGDKYKDDVMVSINGKSWLIQRGKKVTVPRYVAQCLADSQTQDKAAAMQQKALASGFENDSKRLLGE